MRSEIARRIDTGGWLAQRLTFAAVACVLLVALAAPGQVIAADTKQKIEAKLLEQLEHKNEATAWIMLREQADLSGAQTISDWNARGDYVYRRLTETASRSQAGIRTQLRSSNLDFRPFWIVNAVRVTADRATLEALAKRPEVSMVLAPRSYSIPEPKLSKQPAGLDAVEWGVARVNAPNVWSTFGVRGEGIVVANIDSGVLYTHPALVQQYRGNQNGGVFDHNYNWFDPSQVCGSPSTAPCDNNNHGTHTMGTMIGDDGGSNQIGVAPGARWIAAKGCESTSCSDTALLASGQWILAPTDLNNQNARPDLRPNVVNNSWGNSDGSDPFYDAIVNSWVASGIFPAFSNGNSGSSCNTTGSPGSYAQSYSAGAFDINNNIAGFSSRGPSPFGGIVKPDIAAPGVNVRSSIPPASYANFDGTSMASPHVAGTVALMMSAAPSLIGDITTTRALLNQTAVDTADLSCGGTAGANNVYGEGRLDAFAAVDLSPRGPTGTLVGTVIDASTLAPIASASVVADGPSNRTDFSDASGDYDFLLPVGDYDVTASAFGYANANASAVTVADSTTTVQDFALGAVASHAVSGVVRDAAGTPIANATVKIPGTPIPATQTNGSGAYNFSLVPEGTYDVMANAGRCTQSATVQLVIDGAETLDFNLASRTDNYGYTCRELPNLRYIGVPDTIPLSGDDSSYTLPLPFAFPFYGQTYNTAYISTNGNLNFSGPNTAYANDSIPSAAAPNAAVYPYWDDMVVDASTTVTARTIGTAPNRRVLIEWRAMTYYADSSRRIAAEVILFENGPIVTIYAGINADAREQGNSATIGIEAPNGTDAFQYSFNEVVLNSPGFAIVYIPPSVALRDIDLNLEP